MYALYLTSAPNAASFVPGSGLRVLFNPDFNGVHHVFIGAPPGLFDEQFVTAFVVREKEDGFEFNEGPIENALLVLEGTSVLR